MKSSALALFLGLAAQALPAPLQVNQPAAGERRAGGDSRRRPAAISRRRWIAPRPATSSSWRAARRSPATSSCPRRPATVTRFCRTAPTAGLPDAGRAHRPRRTAASSRRFSRPTGRRRCAPRPARITGASCCSSSDPTPAPAATSWRSATASPAQAGDSAAARSRRRSLLHPWRSRARPEARHRDEQRVDHRRRLAHLRHQVDQPGRAGDRRLERARPVPDREQLSRGLRRELHARRRAAGA